MNKPIAVVFAVVLSTPLPALGEPPPPSPPSSATAAVAAAPIPPPPPQGSVAPATSAPPPPPGGYYYPPPPPGGYYYYYPPPPPGGYYYPPPPSANELPPTDDPTPAKPSWKRRSTGAMVVGIVFAGAGGVCLVGSLFTAISAGVRDAFGSGSDYTLPLGLLIGGLTSAVIGAPMIAYGAAREKPSWAGSPGGPGWVWRFH